MNPFAANLRKCYAMHFVGHLHFFAGVLVPFFTDWGGIDFGQVMLLQSYFAACVFLFEVPTGVVADRFGRTVSCALGLGCTAVAALVYASTPHFAVFALAETIWALGLSLYSGADSALIYDSLKALGREAEATQVLARQRSFLLAAMTLAAPVGSGIAALLGLRHAVSLMAVPSLVGVLIALSIREPPTGRSERPAYGALLREGVSLFARSRRLRRLTVDLLLAGTPAFLIIWIYQARLGELGVPIGWFGVVHAGLAASQIGVLALLAPLGRWIGSPYRLLVWLALVPALAYLGLVGNDLMPVNLLLFALICALGMSRPVLLESLMHQEIDSAVRATAVSSANMLNRGVQALLLPLIGLLVDRSTHLAFLALGLALAGAAVYSALAHRGPSRATIARSGR